MSLIITLGLGSSGSTGYTYDTLTLLPGGTLTLAFAMGSAPDLEGPAADVSNWTITGPTDIEVTDVQASGDNVVITTSHPFQDAGSYVLNIPFGIQNVSESPYVGPFAPTFTGTGDFVTVISGTSIDARTIRAQLDAKPSSTVYEPDNWSVDNGLEIVSIARETDLSWLLTTSHQLIGTSYTLTAPGVTT